MKRHVVGRAAALCLAASMAVATCSPGGGDSSDRSQEPPRFAYVYDDLGRLRAIVDPEADTTRCSYDAVGNITGIDRYPSSEVSLLGVTPRRAAPGAEVVVHGTGLAEASVSFDGVDAEPTESSPISVKVTVPEGATSGPVSVAASGDTATLETDFGVDGEQAPRISGVSPTIAAAAHRSALRAPIPHRHLHRPSRHHQPSHR